MIPSSTSWTWERVGRLRVFSEMDLGDLRFPLRPARSVVVDCDGIVYCWGRNDDVWNADTSWDVVVARASMQSVFVVGSLILILLLSYIYGLLGE